MGARQDATIPSAEQQSEPINSARIGAACDRCEDGLVGLVRSAIDTLPRALALSGAEGAAFLTLTAHSAGALAAVAVWRRFLPWLSFSGGCEVLRRVRAAIHAKPALTEYRTLRPILTYGGPPPRILSFANVDSGIPVIRANCRGD
jgi:hypothetical protein